MNAARTAVAATAITSAGLAVPTTAPTLDDR